MLFVCLGCDAEYEWKPGLGCLVCIKCMLVYFPLQDGSGLVAVNYSAANVGMILFPPPSGRWLRAVDERLAGEEPA